MARLKKSQSFYDKAVVRLAAISSIQIPLGIGTDLTADNFNDKIEDMRHKLDDYNTALSTVDEKRRLMQEAEKTLQDFSERILNGIAARFGKNSNEYEMAGGVKKSSRKKPGPSKHIKAA